MSLIRHLGRPVPWITRWSSEVITPGPAVIPTRRRNQVELTFAGELESDRVDGTLWLRENHDRGGVPLWKDVHSARQRTCQMEGRCQVCGDIIEGPLPWVIPKNLALVYEKTKTSIITDVAPTCAQCLKLATAVCPALGPGQFDVYTVMHYRPIAVFGDVWERHGTGIRHTQASVNLSDYLGNMVARQILVELWDYRRRRME